MRRTRNDGDGGGDGSRMERGVVYWGSWGGESGVQQVTVGPSNWYHYWSHRYYCVWIQKAGWTAGYRH